jgi:metal-responsive CopG/Arc/MetJ family transcriptional regulator
MKSNPQAKLTNNEAMLTVRLPKTLMTKVTKYAIKHKVTRSDLVRNILQNVVSSLDSK